jgi:predicted lipoprotein
MAAAARRLARPLLWIVAPLLLVAILRPWTIRPLDRAITRAAFDASTFAAAAWPGILREATQTAGDVSELPTTAGVATAKARFLKGTGIVAAVDRQSRVGVMRVRIPGATQGVVAIQVGPVIRGTAVRDASSFIQFSDFTNQFDFAGAANALNDYVLRAVVGAIPIDALVGRTITFIGAIGKSPVREDGAIEIVPLQLEVIEALVK